MTKFPGNCGGFLSFPRQVRHWWGTKSIKVTEKIVAIDRSRGVRFKSAQELYLAPSRRKVIEV